MLAALLSVSTLAACGGGPDALDEAGAKEALLTQDEFPLDGYTRGTVNTGVQAAGEYDPASAPDTSEECRAALEEFSSIDHTEFLSSSASVRFDAGDDSSLELQVAGVTQEPEKLVDVTHELGTCGEVTRSEGGLEMTTTFEAFENGDVRGVMMRQDVQGNVVEAWMGGRTAGDNLVYAFGTGVTQDELADVVDEQVATIED